MLIAGQRTKPSTYGKLKTGNFKQKFEATYIKQILKNIPAKIQVINEIYLQA